MPQSPSWTRDEILQALADGKMTVEQAGAAIQKPRLFFKISQPKGTVTVCGLRQGIALYADQWRAILDQADELRQFLDENAHLTKDYDPSSDRFIRGRGARR